MHFECLARLLARFAVPSFEPFVALSAACCAHVVIVVANKIATHRHTIEFLLRTLSPNSALWYILPPQPVLGAFTVIVVVVVVQ